MAAVDRKHLITTTAQLEAVFSERPLPNAMVKEIDHINATYRTLIEASPFFALATNGPEGLDCSPRGDPAGFVQVADPKTLLIPDRRGNNRIDSFRNIVEGSGFLQLIFFVPGIDETLRVGGKGKLSVDPELMATMIEFGKPPRAILCVDVKEAYFHCGKALMRSKLWTAERVERKVMPSIGEVIHDQTGLGERESQEVIYERYKTQL
jgi:uncharacterized protein